MSVAGYLGKAAGTLRMAEGDLAGKVQGAVLEGKLAVEDALRREAWGTRKVEEAFESVAGYDPVLRSHCRLDQEG